MRLHQPFLGGQLDAAIDTTAGGSFAGISSPGFAAMKVVAAPDIMAIALDPDGLRGAPEILWVTAHALGATTVTATAAQETTAGRLHLVDEYWVQPYTLMDLGDFDKDWIVVGSGGSAPAFLNGWVNDGTAGYGTAAFRKLPSGLVQVKGLIKTGGIGQVAFTLPAGYRPIENRLFGVASNAAFGQVNVFANGNVTPVAGSNVDMALDFSFFAEQ